MSCLAGPEVVRYISSRRSRATGADRDGPIGQARSQAASACCLDKSDAKRGPILYVSEICTVRAVELATGRVRTLCGNGDIRGGFADGVGDATEFSSLVAVCADPAPDGSLYLLDRYQNETIRVVRKANGSVRTYAGAPTGDDVSIDAPTRLGARFRQPTAMAVDWAGGRLYVAERHRVVREVLMGTMDGTCGVRTLRVTLPAPALSMCVDAPRRRLLCVCEGLPCVYAVSLEVDSPFVELVAGRAASGRKDSPVATAALFKDPLAICMAPNCSAAYILDNTVGIRCLTLDS
jgi:hypothetical protein